MDLAQQNIINTAINMETKLREYKKELGRIASYCYNNLDDGRYEGTWPATDENKEMAKRAHHLQMDAERWVQSALDSINGLIDHLAEWFSTMNSGEKSIGLNLTPVQKKRIEKMLACSHRSHTLREDMKCRCGGPILICNECGFPSCPDCEDPQPNLCPTHNVELEADGICPQCLMDDMRKASREMEEAWETSTETRICCGEPMKYSGLATLSCSKCGSIFDIIKQKAEERRDEGKGSDPGTEEAA